MNVWMSVCITTASVCFPMHAYIFIQCIAFWTKKSVSAHCRISSNVHPPVRRSGRGVYVCSPVLMPALNTQTIMYCIILTKGQHSPHLQLKDFSWCEHRTGWGSSKQL